MLKIRRDVLKRMAERGELILAGSYHFDDMTGGEHRENLAVPVEIMPDKREHCTEGICYLYQSDFTSSSGYSSLSADGLTAHLGVHSNCNYDLKRADGQPFNSKGAKLPKAQRPENKRMQEFLQVKPAPVAESPLPASAGEPEKKLFSVGKSKFATKAPAVDCAIARSVIKPEKFFVVRYDGFAVETVKGGIVLTQTPPGEPQIENSAAPRAPLAAPATICAESGQSGGNLPDAPTVKPSAGELEAKFEAGWQKSIAAGSVREPASQPSGGMPAVNFGKPTPMELEIAARRDFGQYNFQNRKTLIAGYVFAKNDHSAKYQAAKKAGGKPSDYWVESDPEDVRRFRAALEAAPVSIPCAVAGDETPVEIPVTVRGESELYPCDFWPLVRQVVAARGATESFPLALGNVDFWMDGENCAYSLPAPAWDLNRMANDLTRYLTAPKLEPTPASFACY